MGENNGEIRIAKMSLKNIMLEAKQGHFRHSLGSLSQRLDAFCVVKAGAELLGHLFADACW